jgi:acyl dehydratase
MGYYICKVSFYTGEVSKSTGKAKASKSEILVEAESVTEAEANLHKHLAGDNATAHLDFEVTSVAQSKIESVVHLRG